MIKMKKTKKTNVLFCQTIFNGRSLFSVIFLLLTHHEKYLFFSLIYHRFRRLTHLLDMKFNTTLIIFHNNVNCLVRNFIDSDRKLLFRLNVIVRIHSSEYDKNTISNWSKWNSICTCAIFGTLYENVLKFQSTNMRNYYLICLNINEIHQKRKVFISRLTRLISPKASDDVIFKQHHPIKPMFQFKCVNECVVTLDLFLWMKTFYFLRCYSCWISIKMQN